MKPTKRKFFSQYWVESRHEYLKSLPVTQARHLLQTFDDEDVSVNVNCRTYQHSYICDFLQDVWDISHRSFWHHIRVALNHPEGMVIADNDFHLEIMKTERMPSAVFKQILKTITRIQNETFLTIHIEIVIAQVDRHPEASNMALFKEWFAQLDISLKKLVRTIILEQHCGQNLQRVVDA
jgi:hypothetical protein